jgi:peptidyl-prolyl cis-trans isomerase C
LPTGADWAKSTQPRRTADFSPFLKDGAMDRVIASLSLPCLIVSLALFAAPVPHAAAQDADPVVARVNGVELRQSDLAFAEEDLGTQVQQLQQMPPETKREYLITYLADMMLVAKAAEDKKLGDSNEFKKRLIFARNKLLMEAVLQAEAKAALTDANMRKVYDDATKQMTAETEVHARHILVEKEDEAKTILADLKKGGDFAAIAKEKSKDPGAADGGDLGFFTKDQMVPEFSEVAFKLEKGQLSDPVKTQFGWHIIKVEDKRTKPIPEFEKVKDQIETYVTRKTQAEFITKLRDTGKIERLDAQGKVIEPKK